MYLERMLRASEILEKPTAMDRVEDAYVVVKEDQKWMRHNHKDLLQAMNMMNTRGWETINITFMQPGNVMVALLKNPRAKNKNVGET
jgi:hypothetical protein